MTKGTGAAAPPNPMTKAAKLEATRRRECKHGEHEFDDSEVTR